jgi:hypothetical protein
MGDKRKPESGAKTTKLNMALNNLEENTSRHFFQHISPY